MGKKKEYYYFTGSEIVKVVFDSSKDHSDPRSESDYRDITHIYRNIKTNKYYYINKGIQHYSIDIDKGEIFDSQRELIECMVNEYLEKINFYKNKIKLLWDIEKELKK